MADKVAAQDASRSPLPEYRQNGTRFSGERQFERGLNACHVALPVRLAPDEKGIVDAHGVPVFTVEGADERDAEEVVMLAALVIAAININGGYRAEAPRG